MISITSLETGVQSSLFSQGIGLSLEILVTKSRSLYRDILKGLDIQHWLNLPHVTKKLKTGRDLLEINGTNRSPWS